MSVSTAVMSIRPEVIRPRHSPRPRPHCYRTRPN